MFSKLSLVALVLCLAPGSYGFWIFGSSDSVTDLCANVPDGTLLPDPEDRTCFYECSNHRTLKFQCPPNLIFLKETHVCGFDPDAPTKRPHVVSKFDCTGKANGFYPDPESETKFHECWDHLAYDFECPYPTIFDKNSQACKYTDHPITTHAPITGPTNPTTAEPTRPTAGPTNPTTAEPTRPTAEPTHPTGEPTRHTTVPVTQTTRGRHH